jgi:competence protein ComEC
LWLFLPRGMPARWLGALLFLPLLLPNRPPPARGAFEAVVIDVGQGLSVFVRTREHALLFDAGARYPSEFDLGEAAVLPTLHALGIHALDVLMVSHGDNDHAGGAAAVAKAYPQALHYSGEPQRVPIPSAPCHAGQAWQWDDVAFRVLNPPIDDAADASATSGNDHSCVLLIEGKAGRLLLTGDISNRVEPDVARAVGAGAPLVLVVPHHGSKSSSGAEFIAKLRPLLAIVSAGWRSRFGHPNPQVVERYRAADVPLENTAVAGALQIAFPPDAAPRLASRERERQRRYWRE